MGLFFLRNDAAVLEPLGDPLDFAELLCDLRFAAHGLLHVFLAIQPEVSAPAHHHLKVFVLSPEQNVEDVIETEKLFVCFLPLLLELFFDLPDLELVFPVVLVLAVARTLSEVFVDVFSLGEVRIVFSQSVEPFLQVFYVFPFDLLPFDFFVFIFVLNFIVFGRHVRIECVVDGDDSVVVFEVGVNSVSSAVDLIDYLEVFFVNPGLNHSFIAVVLLRSILGRVWLPVQIQTFLVHGIGVEECFDLGLRYRSGWVRLALGEQAHVHETKAFVLLPVLDGLVELEFVLGLFFGLRDGVD